MRVVDVLTLVAALVLCSTTAMGSTSIDMYIERYTEMVLKYADFDDWADAIFPALDEHPSSVYAKVLAADCWIAKHDVAKAEELVTEAEELIESHPEAYQQKEKSYAAAWRHWLSGRLMEALEVFEGIVAEDHRDLMAMKRAQLLAFSQGLSDRLLAVTNYSENNDRPYFHGMRGFALEQLVELEAAEAEARRALQILPDADPWAHHALAHVLLFSNRPREGIKFMESVSDDWRNSCDFMREHNWWHIALFYMEIGDYDKVLSLFDEQVWHFAKWYTEEQQGAVEILWKLEVRDVDRARLENRWADVASHVRSNVQSLQGGPMFDLLLVRVLCEYAEDEELLAAHLEKVVAYPDSVPDPERAERLRKAWVPYAKGIVQFYKKDDVKGALEAIRPTLSDISVIGGSSEQRLIFKEFFDFLQSQVNSGNGDDKKRGDL